MYLGAKRRYINTLPFLSFPYSRILFLSAISAFVLFFFGLHTHSSVRACLFTQIAKILLGIITSTKDVMSVPAFFSQSYCELN